MYQELIPIDMYQELIPIDMYQELIPIDMYQELIPIDMYQELLPIDNDIMNNCNSYVRVPFNLLTSCPHKYRCHLRSHNPSQLLVITTRFKQ
jgi:hypothetical protein